MNNGFSEPHIISKRAPQTPILLALSGGADSTALLHMLSLYCEKYGTPLYAAHVNHMIRGSDADADEAFCRSISEKYTCCKGFFSLREDVPARAKASGRSLEHEARIVRYDFFEKIMRANGIPLLATAHNADDNSETVIFNMSRGSALRGICGIPRSRPFSDGMIIRPILDISKREILDYCAENSLEFVSDKTNSDTEYSRNRIRANVIPELEIINPSVRKNISRMCELLKSDNDFLQSCAESLVDKAMTERGLPLSALKEAHPSIASRAIVTLFEREYGENAIENVHLSALLELISGGSTRFSLSLPQGKTALAESGYLTFVSTSQAVISDECISEPRNDETALIPGFNILWDGCFAVILSKYGAEPPQTVASEKNVYKLSTAVYINFDTIDEIPFVRTRREGDVILTGKNHKKVRRLMNESGIPASLRDKLPLLCDKKGILWVPYGRLRDGISKKDPTHTVALYKIVKQ